MVLFEGNDFIPFHIDDKELGARKSLLHTVKDSAKSYMLAVRRVSRVAPFTYGATTRAYSLIVDGRRSEQDQANRAFLGHLVTGQPFAFLRAYMQATRAEPPAGLEADLTTMLASVKPDLVLFVPTSHRVYQHLLRADSAAESGSDPLPHRNWEILSRAAGQSRIDAIDLTGPLKQAAEAGLAQKRTVFFPDDTHWSGDGIAVAAGEIASWAARSPRIECRGR